MLSDQRNMTMAKAAGLIFSLFDVTLAREMPFGIPQYTQGIPNELTSVLLCVPFIFADSEVSIWWWHMMASFHKEGNCPYFS